MRTPPDAVRTPSLCAETQGRRIMAALVSDAVEEALGLAMGGASVRQGAKTAPGELSRPAGKE